MAKEYDLLIVGGEVTDGSGEASYTADIGLRGDRIVTVSPDLDKRKATVVLEALGLTVCPGFIDLHSHSDFTLHVNQRAESKVRQGVTTEVVGNCGFTAAPVRQEHFRELMQYLVNTVALTPEEEERWDWKTQAAFANEIGERGIAVNIATLVGHGTLRVAVMGFAKRTPDSAELVQMSSMLEREIEEGVWGLSSGLQYDPASFADMDELTTLCRVTASGGGIYATHLRSEGQYLLACIAEAAEIGRRSDVAVQISHLKAHNAANWGKVKKALALMDEARTRGVNIGWDVYPYTAFGSALIDLLPPWVRVAGVDRMVELLRDPEHRRRAIREMTETRVEWENPMAGTKWSSIRIASVRSVQNRCYEGLNMEQIGKLIGLPPAEAVVELLLAEEGAVKMIFFGMCEEDLETVLRHPLTIFASDGRAVATYGPLSRGKIHPRYYGTFPRLLGHYAREKKIITFEDAVKKMTLLPALRLKLKERGLIKEGYIADLVVLNREEVLDMATFDKPHCYPRGIIHVIVNGQVVVENSLHTSRLPGRVLHRRRDGLSM